MASVVAKDVAFMLEMSFLPALNQQEGNYC
jgi:hypothetical protein